MVLLPWACTWRAAHAERATRAARTVYLIYVRAYSCTAQPYCTAVRAYGARGGARYYAVPE